MPIQSKTIAKEIINLWFPKDKTRNKRLIWIFGHGAYEVLPVMKLLQSKNMYKRGLHKANLTIGYLS